MLDRHTRTWLAVADPVLFDAVLMPAPGGGVLLVPVEDITARVAAVEL